MGIPKRAWKDRHAMNLPISNETHRRLKKVAAADQRMLKETVDVLVTARYRALVRKGVIEPLPPLPEEEKPRGPRVRRGGIRPKPEDIRGQCPRCGEDLVTQFADFGSGFEVRWVCWSNHNGKGVLCDYWEEPKK